MYINIGSKIYNFRDDRLFKLSMSKFLIDSIAIDWVIKTIIWCSVVFYRADRTGTADIITGESHE